MRSGSQFTEGFIGRACRGVLRIPYSPFRTRMLSGFQTRSTPKDRADWQDASPLLRLSEKVGHRSAVPIPHSPHLPLPYLVVVSADAVIDATSLSRAWSNVNRSGSSARPGGVRTPRLCAEPRARIERGPRSLFSYFRALRRPTIAIAAGVGLEQLQKDHGRPGAHRRGSHPLLKS
jgi:hypothetical protein